MNTALFATVVSAWLATYALHSTVILGAAWGVCRVVQSDAARDVVWKIAIVGSILTPLLPPLVRYTPLIGRHTISTPGGASDALFDARSPRPRAAGAVDGAVAEKSSGGRRPSPAALSASGHLRTPANYAESRAPVALNVAAWLTAAWLICVLGMLARLLVLHSRLFAALSDRTEVTTGPLPAMLAGLRRKARIWIPVRLSTSTACPTPIALGAAEICIPQRFIDELVHEQQITALAHELSHLKRRDPSWQLALGVVESVFFFQPLNRVGRRRLRGAAENLCDDWAVEQTGAPLDLANCLAEIAHWVGSATVPSAMPAIAEGGCPLVRRIERLTNWKPARSGPAGVPQLLAIGFIALVASSAPVFSASTSAESAAFSSKPDAAGTSFRGKVILNPPLVIRFPGPSRPLAERWAWALSHHTKAPFWIAWALQGQTSGDVAVVSNSDHANNFVSRGQPLGDILSLESDDQHHSIVLLGFERGPATPSTLKWVRLQRAADSTIRDGRDIVWLGEAGDPESLSLLRMLRLRLKDPALRAEVAAAYSLHGDDHSVIDAVMELMAHETDASVRSEAIQWLPRLHTRSIAAVSLLRATALTDSERSLRVEAVDALRYMAGLGNARAQNALESIADIRTDATVRSEAMQALAANHK